MNDGVSTEIVKKVCADKGKNDYGVWKDKIGKPVYFQVPGSLMLDETKYLFDLSGKEIARSGGWEMPKNNESYRNLTKDLKMDEDLAVLKPNEVVKRSTIKRKAGQSIEDLRG